MNILSPVGACNCVAISSLSVPAYACGALHSGFPSSRRAACRDARVQNVKCYIRIIAARWQHTSVYISLLFALFTHLYRIQSSTSDRALHLFIPIVILHRHYGSGRNVLPEVFASHVCSPPDSVSVAVIDLRSSFFVSLK
ncbi:hypothetical protein NP493_50g05104 [Ridgeia piscesae]|uniref:Uncharacterized protein n=1 Tax=Ridgeia piscesae TaxID=27915 RepID=A0AAD9UJK7_RIDPI|nr:hypothetical protein NP493_50g05104 [Ridgeia piscesae]